MPNQISKLREKMLEDPKFRQLVMSKTAEALKEIGIEPTSQNVALVRNVIDSIENLYKGFDEEDRFIT